MKKIPTVFIRDPDDPRHVTAERRPGCEWVFNGYGQATRKWDGTAVLIDEHGAMFKRRAVRRGQPAPEGFFEAEHDLEDEEIHDRDKIEGWVPCNRADPADRWHFEALDACGCPPVSGTYELVGPKVQGNPDDYEVHTLVHHGDAIIPAVPTDFDALKLWLADYPGEGIVWHHPDGRMAKIKRRDFY